MRHGVVVGQWIAVTLGAKILLLSCLTICLTVS